VSQIKASIKCDDVDESSFAGSVCLLSISVGQEAHEDERLAAAFELINNSFGGCIIALYDSLQRYTMALIRNQSPDYFYSMAVKEGELWLERNEKYLKRLNNLKSVIHWDEWLKHPHYSDYRKNIQNLIETDTNFEKIFHSVILDYLKRFNKRAPVLDQNHAYKVCFNYLLEECAAFCLWTETGCAYEIYPGKHNAAIEEVRRRFVLPSKMLTPLSLMFKPRKNLRPQQFITLNDME
jgi:tRNA-dependent cyclodipeptide synthase